MLRPHPCLVLGLALLLAACGSRSALEGSRRESGGAPSGIPSGNGGMLEPWSSDGPSGGATSGGGARAAAGGGAPAASGGADCEAGSAFKVDEPGFPSAIYEFPCDHGPNWQARLSRDGARALVVRESTARRSETWSGSRDGWQRLPVSGRVSSWNYLWLAEDSDSAWFASGPSTSEVSVEPSRIWFKAFEPGAFESSTNLVRENLGILQTGPINSPGPIARVQLGPRAQWAAVAMLSGELLVFENSNWDSTSWPGEAEGQPFVMDVTDSRVGVLRPGRSGGLSALIRSDGAWQRWALPSFPTPEVPLVGGFTPLDLVLARDSNIAFASWTLRVENIALPSVGRLDESGTWEIAPLGPSAITSAEGPGLALTTSGDMGFLVWSDCGACPEGGRLYASTFRDDAWVTTPVAQTPRCQWFGHVSVGDNGTRAFGMLCDDGAFFAHSMGESESFHLMELPVGPDDVPKRLPHVELDRSGRKALITWRVGKTRDSRARLRATVLEF